MKSLLFKKFLLLVLATSIALLACEVLLRLFVPVRNVGPSFTEFDTTYGKRLKKNFHCQRITPEFTMSFTTNSQGFRGPEIKGHAKDFIVFLGDSFTMGYGVNDGEEYPRLLQRRLDEQFPARQIEVINLGLGDSGNGVWLKFLEKDITAYQPRCAVLQVCGNDFTDNHREGLYQLDAGNLVEFPVPEAGWKRQAQGVIEGLPGLSSTYLASLFKQAATQIGSGASPAVEEASDRDQSEAKENYNQLTYALITRSLDLCRAQRIRIILLGVGIAESEAGRLQKIAGDFGAIFRRIPTRTESPHLYYEVDGHWKKEGHEAAAKTIAPLVVERLQGSDVEPPGSTALGRKE
jgi:lysophospholipase L1-like esterase